MRETTRFFKWLVAAALGVAMPLGPAVADNPQSITLRVPVKLKKMLPEAETVTVKCVLENDGQFSEPRKIVNGEFDQVIEMVFTAKAGETFAEAKSYFCLLLINHGSSFTNAPQVGTPPHPSRPLHLLARPDEFFQDKVTGPLDGGTFVDGIVGPKDLAVPPKPRQ